MDNIFDKKVKLPWDDFEERKTFHFCPRCGRSVEQSWQCSCLDGVDHSHEYYCFHCRIITTTPVVEVRRYAGKYDIGYTVESRTVPKIIRTEKMPDTLEPLTFEPPKYD